MAGEATATPQRAEYGIDAPGVVRGQALGGIAGPALHLLALHRTCSLARRRLVGQRAWRVQIGSSVYADAQSIYQLAAEPVGDQREKCSR
jgi:hypothetical protein